MRACVRARVCVCVFFGFVFVVVDLMNTYLYFALDVCDKKAVVNCSPNSSLSMPLFILCAIDCIGQSNLAKLLTTENYLLRRSLPRDIGTSVGSHVVI